MTDWLTPSQQRAWRALLSMNTHLHARLARSLQSSSDLSYADFMDYVQAMPQKPEAVSKTKYRCAVRSIAGCSDCLGVR